MLQSYLIFETVKILSKLQMHYKIFYEFLLEFPKITIKHKLKEH